MRNDKWPRHGITEHFGGVAGAARRFPIVQASFRNFDDLVVDARGQDIGRKKSGPVLSSSASTSSGESVRTAQLPSCSSGMVHVSMSSSFSSVRNLATYFCCCSRSIFCLVGSVSIVDSGAEQ